MEDHEIFNVSKIHGEIQDYFSNNPEWRETALKFEKIGRPEKIDIKNKALFNAVKEFNKEFEDMLVLLDPSRERGGHSIMGKDNPDQYDIIQAKVSIYFSALAIKALDDQIREKS